ncbi:hypothetical protein [Endozoicomonas euniceicola]|uniref:hypothetical protein n=1 Tax=Endozoicomonas euniceicola TaxID=1234143 RepID=UPI00384C1C86
MVRKLQSLLRVWFSENGIDYPWRSPALSDYQIIVTECLLQRTRAETVSKYWATFFEAIPSWEALVAEDRTKLKKLLKPLGLVDRRVSYLIDLAWEVIEMDACIPDSADTLRELSGIGQYISNAICTLLFDQRLPLLDVNFARVIERLTGPRRLVDIRHDPKLQYIANKLVDTDDSIIISWAVLDLAKLVCIKKEPKCHVCPLNKHCLYYSTMQRNYPF